MNILETLKNLIYLVPLMIYYFFESVIISIFVSFVWKIFLESKIGITLGYFDWVCIIWLIKVVFFDVFKLLPFFYSVEQQVKNEINKEQS